MKLTAVVALAAIMTGACWAAAAGEWTALISRSGRVQLNRGRTRVGTISPGMFEATWRGGEFSDSDLPDDDGVLRGRLRAPGGAVIETELRPTTIPGGGRFHYRLTPQSAVTVNSMHVSLDLPIRMVAGRAYALDDRRGTVPVEHGETHLASSGAARSLALALADGSALRFEFPEPTPVLVQDNRRWGPTLSVRIGPQLGEGRRWPAGDALDVAFDLTTGEGMRVEVDRPVTIQAGPEWVPLEVELDVEPGSALDFSQMGMHDPPAGRHGWLIARPDGRLAFERSPGTARRFYGVNFCFSAHYITHEQADRLAERLMRIGYNTVRFHHYEGELVDTSDGTSTALRPEKLDQLDYLFAALKQRGIYVTTDLFVSRPVRQGEVWPGGQGRLEMNDFKMLVPVNERAFDNWKEFSRNLLTHRNPYTGLTWAEDPALAWLSMINEGNFGNYIGGVDGRVEEDWRRAWNAFLRDRYGTPDALLEAWGEEVEGDPADGTVPLARNPREDSPRGRDLAAFLAATERDMFLRMERFLRDEIGTGALLTNANGWTNLVPGQAARSEYDYVDDHFYVDHPQFIERPWRLPSRSPNASPVAQGVPGGRGNAFVRLLDRPFTISEYNYSGPGRYRGVGGILTGCMGALQDWSVLWRFAYSHSRDNLLEPRPAGYFDIATDPLNQAADRAAICLYLRGDMRPAPHTVAIALPEEEMLADPPRSGGVAPPWSSLAWVTRVGTIVAPAGADVPADVVLPLDGGQPYRAGAGQEVLDLMRGRGWLEGNATDLASNRLQSETGELLIDAPRDVMVLDTPRTVGCYAPAGETVEAGPAMIRIEGAGATVWVSSLDGAPIPQSRRLLITHLTDLQNTGAHFAESARQTLLEWGSLPHLVRDGAAAVTLRLDGAREARVWALSTGGRRLAPVPAAVGDGRLEVQLRVRGPEGARMSYEVETR